MQLIRTAQSWALGLIMLALRASCRVTLHGDPRARLRASATPYVYSILHAHQICAAIHREKNTAAMVSQSGDGQLLIPGFWLLGIKPIRGSSQIMQQSKNGRKALTELTMHVQSGAPALLAVDGPRGPRNRVRKGIAALSRESGAAVLNVVAVPSRRWILRGAWDRLQIPQPFCRIDAYFAEPLWPTEEETVEQYRKRIESSLNELEQTHDAGEAQIARDRPKRRPDRG
ncbi:lysophospholipid acyltransferase family protein [Roseimaritima sediminicola]|uniref:lysophospholipid acyltransferase family protein n=1 Tax=Roseimaritima sediminicola TaxID=2662066 RepID=UPI0012984DC4|nr:lysophospholipid acyltransferase family protein [Roseimaritima sediminicola]